MKYKLFITLMLSFTAQASLLDKEKVIENDIASDQTGVENEFQINFVPGEPKISDDTKYTLLVGIPAIGIYGAPYNFRKRLALIKLSPEMMIPAMPEVLQKQLIKALAPSKTIDQALTGKAIYAQIMINGQTEDKKQGPFNMVFHPFSYAYKRTFLHQDNIPMGLFAVNGITGQDITVNQFKALNVNAHNGGAIFALSPNNARFNITLGRGISTFWSAAYSPDKRFVTITYHILANNDAMQTALVDILGQSNTLSDVLTRLLIQTKTMSDADKQALENAIETIREMITPPEIDPFDALKQQLADLTRSLQQLNEQLSQLS